MLAIPGMIHSLESAKTKVITRLSVWNLPLRLWPRLFPHAAHPATAHLVSLSLALVVVLVIGAAWVARRDRDPAPGVVGATSAWLVFSAYVLPWYTVWALPTAALRTRSRLAWLVGIQGAVIMAVSVVPRDSLAGRGVVSDVVHLTLPVLLVALFVWAIIPSLTHREERIPPT